MSEERISLEGALAALLESLGSIKISNKERRIIFYEFIIELSKEGEITSDKAVELLQKADKYLETIT